MPFKRSGDPDKPWKSPGGKKWTNKQKRAYHATEGFSRPKMSRPLNRKKK
jgi:hypothetical protein